MNVANECLESKHEEVTEKLNEIHCSSHVLKLVCFVQVFMVTVEYCQNALSTFKKKKNKTPQGVNVGRVGRYLQSLWIYVEKNKFHVDSSKFNVVCHRHPT